MVTIAFGLNHRHVPLEVLESVSVSPEGRDKLALDLLEPDLRKKATLLFPKLVEVEYDFYEGFENVPPDTRDITDAQRCQELKQVFVESKSAFGG